ncbi:hypothetical protein Q9189_004340 [Teloschistes chrysophthalmus]
MPSNIEMAENLVNQVMSIARNTKAVCSRPSLLHIDRRLTKYNLKQPMDTYPTEELEWVATTAFNRAVEFYSTSQDKICRRWAEKAISLAELNDDGGLLHQLLQRKYMDLAWEL